MANVVIEVILDSTGVKEGFNKLDKKVQKQSKKISARMGKAFKRQLSNIFSVTVGNVLARSISNAMSKVSTALSNTVKDAKDLENAFTGLRAVAGAMGQDVSKVSDIAKRFSEDGLIPLADSAAALKNILATGVDADVAEKALLALRDSASFNRQGQLDLGQAIRGATEGIKNQNSIMVDNAGITKNISLIVKEYASSIGRSVASLSDQEKKQAIINGIIKEAALFQGNYNLLLETYSGAQTKAAGQAKFLSAELGELVTKNRSIITLLGEEASAYELLRKALKANKQEVNNYIDTGLVLLIVAQQGVVDTVSDTIKSFRILSAGMQALQLAMHDPIQSWKDFKKAFVDIRDEEIFPEIQSGLQSTLEKMLAAASAARMFGEASTEAGNESKEAARVSASSWNFAGVNFQNVAKGMSISADQLSKNINKSIGGGVVNAFAAFGGALANGENALAAFGLAMLSTFGDILIQLGTQVLFAGILMQAVPILFGLQGAAAIIAGAGLIVAGGALKAVAGGGGAGAPSSGGGVASSSGSVSGSSDVDFGVDDTLEREEAQTTVTVNVEGNILDRRETGLELAEVINEAFGSNGVTLTQAGA